MQNTPVNVTPDATTDCALTEIMTSHDAQNIIDTASGAMVGRVETLSDNVSFFPRLQFRDAQGNYVMATESQIWKKPHAPSSIATPPGPFLPQRRFQKNFSEQNLPAVTGKFLQLPF